MTDKKRRVLVLDSDFLFGTLLKSQLKRAGSSIDILFSDRTEEAEDFYKIFSDEICLIAVGSCVESFKSRNPSIPSSVIFVKKISKDFKGVMIAVSLIPAYRKYLLNAGCTVQVGDKFQLWKTIIDYLK